MCGFAGEIVITPHQQADHEHVLPMLQAILHRGPDDVGLWMDPARDACLAHARLALVDPLGGKQPMADPTGQVVIAYNGETYGFERARAALMAQGVVFQTRCDTEVLLQLYLHHGPDFVRDLEGEFAFVLFDRRKGQTMLARDRFGVKPLFIAQCNGLLLFGSEIKAILAHPFCERRLDAATLSRRLQGVFLPQESLFAGISAIEPGSYILARPGESGRHHLVSRRYADLDPAAMGSAQMSFEAAVDGLEPLLAQAVKRRFHGDEPVGLFLSGGTDSSSVAAFAAEVAPSSGRLTAYSIDFTDSSDSEGAHAAATAKALGLRHVTLPVKTADLEAAFADTIWHVETVMPNTHGIAKMLLAHHAKREVKAVLTGEGADELHGGYAYFQHSGLLGASHAPGSRSGRGRGTRQTGAGLALLMRDYGPRDGVLPQVTAALRQHPLWQQASWQGGALLAEGLGDGGVPYAALRAVIGGRVAGWLTSRQFRHRVVEQIAAGRLAGGRHSAAHLEADILRHDGAGALLAWLTRRLPEARRLDDASLSRLVSTIADLPGYNLCVLADRVEMAAGLEARLPFLDREVAEFLWRLPPEFHHSNGHDAGRHAFGESKRVLRAVLARRLPQAALRPKHTFMTPTTFSCHLLRGRLGREWLSPGAIRRAGIFHPATLAAVHRSLGLLARHRTYAYQLAAYLNMALSAHLIQDMFCDNFHANVQRRAPMSLAELRQRLGVGGPLDRAAA